jgi:hypothetical protein
MSRFFNSTNIDRFRKLASDGIAATERNRILDVLAKEWDAFIRENRASSETCVKGTTFRNQE